MVTKLVVRVLGSSGELLGWTEIAALARGDGALWSQGPATALVDVDGTPKEISVHWADVNVEVKIPINDGKPIARGQSIRICDGPTALLRVGEPPRALAPVTIRRSQSVAVPFGKIGALVP